MFIPGIKPRRRSVDAHIAGEESVRARRARALSDLSEGITIKGAGAFVNTARILPIHFITIIKP